MRHLRSLDGAVGDGDVPGIGARHGSQGRLRSPSWQPRRSPGCCSPRAAPRRRRQPVPRRGRDRHGRDSTPTPQATIAFTPASNTSDVAPGEPVTVTATDGKLTGVT